VITGTLAVSGTVDAGLQYQITATNNPASYAAAGLPAGLVLDATTSLISGRPAASGVYEVSITAANQHGAGRVDLTFTIIIAGTPPIFDPVPVPTPYPTVMIHDKEGNLYVCDPLYDRTMRISASGVTMHDFVTSLDTLSGLALDPAGENLHMTDTGHGMVKKIALANGDVTVIASGLNRPVGIAAASNGIVFVSCAGDNTICMLVPAAQPFQSEGVRMSLMTLPPVAREAPAATHTVQVLAGGVRGSTDGVGAGASFNIPTGLAYNHATNMLYVVDSGNSTICEINIATRRVTTLAGVAEEHGMTDGSGTSVRFNTPEALAIDSAGLVYIADTGNNSMRVLDPITQKMTSIVSETTGMDSPAGIAINTFGDGAVSIVDTNNAAIFTLKTKPAFVIKPANRNVTESQRITIDATAWGSPAPGYKWYKNNTLISSATTAIHELALARPTDTGVYTVTAGNSAGVETASFTLTVTATSNSGGNGNTGGGSDGGSSGGGGGGDSGGGDESGGWGWFDKHLVCRLLARAVSHPIFAKTSVAITNNPSQCRVAHDARRVRSLSLFALVRFSRTQACAVVACAKP
jgi:DNA-binding beta-propeller fold protein YncE